MLRAMSPIAGVELRAPRLVLRPWRAEDRAGYVAFDRENSGFFARYSPPMPGAGSAEESFERHLARSEDGLRSGTGFRCLALRGGEVVGFIGFSDVVRSASQRCNVGYRVGERFCRQGYGLEMLNAMLDHAFAEAGLGLHRVECAVQPTNEPSLKLAEKAGFRREGYAPRFLFIGDGWKDHVLLAKTSEEHVGIPKG